MQQDIRYSNTFLQQPKLSIKISQINTQIKKNQHYNTQNYENKFLETYAYPQLVESQIIRQNMIRQSKLSNQSIRSGSLQQNNGKSILNDLVKYVQNQSTISILQSENGRNKQDINNQLDSLIKRNDLNQESIGNSLTYSKEQQSIKNNKSNESIKQKQFNFNKNKPRIYENTISYQNNVTPPKDRSKSIDLGVYEFKTKAENRSKARLYFNSQQQQNLTSQPVNSQSQQLLIKRQSESNKNIQRSQDELISDLKKRYEQFQVNFNELKSENITLKSKVSILEDEKGELLNKINWLNSLVEEMIKMTKEKSVKNLNQIKKQEEKLKKSQQLQTSFILQTNSKQDDDYKVLYERSLLERRNLVEEVQEITHLQNLYAQQFKLILGQIKQIKQKQQIIRLDRLRKQNESRNNHKPIFRDSQISSTSNFQNSHFESNESPRRIFQNSIIYELKKDNEKLYQKYKKMKSLYQQLKKQARQDKPVDMNSSLSQSSDNSQIFIFNKQKYHLDRSDGLDYEKNSTKFKYQGGYNKRKHAQGESNINKFNFRPHSITARNSNSIGNRDTAKQFNEFKKINNYHLIQTSQLQGKQSYNRYNHFIKSLKQKFGINSSIMNPLN